MRSRLFPVLTLLALAALPAAAHTRTLSEPNAVLQPHLSSDVEIGSEIALPPIITDAPDTLPVFTRSRKLASGFFELRVEPNIQRTLDLGQESRLGYDYMHARYYNPNLGRFLSVDPALDLKRSIREPQSWNRYSYVVNNPIRRIDPDGRVDGNSDDFAQQLFPDDRGAQREFDQGVAENLAIGAATVVGGIAGWAARGVLTTAVLSPRLALTAGSILASMAGQPTVGGIRSVVVPGGTKIGVEGTSGAIRFMKGGFAEAKAMFQSLAKGGTVTKLGKDVLTVDLKGVGQVTLRTVSSTEGVRATVQLNVKGVGVREIKYVDEILK